MNIPAIVKEYIESERKSESYHPSAIDGCAKQEWYRLHGYPQDHPRDPESCWTLARYGTYENYFVNAIDGDDSLPQFELSLGKWHGFVDLMLDGNIVEIKSISPWSLKWGSAPYNHHKEQVWTYWVMAKDNGVYVDKATLVYIERWDDRNRDLKENLPAVHQSYFEKALVVEPDYGTPTMIQFDVTPTQEEEAAIRMKMARLEKLWKGEEEPATPYKEPDEHPWNCTRKQFGKRVIACPYFTECWGQQWTATYEMDDDELPF